jgi:putative thiamine transport system permease protein
MILAALPQTDAQRRLAVAASLGYGRIAGIALTVLPGLYAQIRLPVYAVLAYAMTCVDMAMILGPSLPPSLSVQVAIWAGEPTLTLRGLAAAGALLQLALVIGAIAGWRLAEQAAACGLRRAAAAGWRAPWADTFVQPTALALALTPALALIAGLAGLALWSIAGPWPFPDALPGALSAQSWVAAAPGLWRSGVATLMLATVSTGMALALVLACLQAEHRYALNPSSAAMLLLYLPLIMPQVAFLPGLQRLALMAGLQGGFWAVAACHLVFVLPYVFLSLSAPWRAWDGRLAVQVAALGASPARVFWRLRLPMLLAPVLTAVAVGMAVSVGQYLATLLIGGGRVETLTTEAVALSSGGNRRVIGAYALLQLALPAAGFALALALPRLIYANRRGVGLA